MSGLAGGGRWRLAAIASVVAIAVCCTSAGVAGAEVTGANDNLRTGWYPDEPELGPAVAKNVQQAFSRQLTGSVYAQPLLADGQLLVATEGNWAYGLNPITGQTLWERQFGTPINALEAPIECGDLPTLGITSTPVVDTSTNVAYLTTNVKEGSSIVWYMHAIELANKGHEASGFPVKIQGKAQNLPGVTFEASQEMQRPALLLMNGVVYAGFGSHCDREPYEGWIAGVSTSGVLTTMWAAATRGAGIWQAGSGLISDAPGQILFTTGNGGGASGEHDPPKGPGSNPPEGRLGDAVVRVAVQTGDLLKAIDFFSPFEDAKLAGNDFDLGASAPIALPSQYFGTPSTPNLLVQSGKQGYVYLLNRENLGGMGQGPEGHDAVVQRIGKFGGVWDGAAVWPGDGGYVYLPAVSPAENTEEVGDHLRVLKYEVAEGRPSLSLAATSPDSFGFGSGSPIVTSDGTTSGSAVVWTTWCPNKACESAELRSYSPVPVEAKPVLLSKLPIGQASKFSRPVASAGFVYVGNRKGALFAFSVPRMAASSHALDFGEALTGSQRTEQVTFTNSGAGSLTIKSLHAPSTAYQLHGLPAEGTVLQPGAGFTVEITFAPSQPGNFGDSLSFSTQAGQTSVSLAAIAAAPNPRLSASTASLELGEAPLATPLAGHVAFTNTGNVNLTIASSRLPAPPFGVQGLPAQGSLLRPGEGFTVAATFLSAVPGHYAGSVAVTTEAGETSVALTGTASSPAPGPGAGSVLGFGSNGSPLLSPVPVLSALQLHLPRSAHPRSARLSFTLSAPAGVRVALFRRVAARHCAPAALACGRFLSVRTSTVRGLSGANQLTLQLQHLPPGVYRVIATPLQASGAAGAAHAIYFKKRS
jgi:HYDIN/CFA65/VesB-like, Ig-like domain